MSADNICIPSKVTILGDDDDDGVVYDVTFTLSSPSDLLHRQIGRDGMVKGLLVKCANRQVPDGSTWDGWISLDLDDADGDESIRYDYSVSFDLSAAALSSNNLGVNLGDSPAISDDNPVHRLFAYILSQVTLYTDTHWDCYCKTQQVCGCGCDPKHDGW